MIGSGLLLWGILKNQNNIKTIASVILVVMALIAIPVFLTGEPAEDAVEKLPGVSESIIELHEDAAVLATWLMGITGLAALVALLFQWQKKPLSKALFLTTCMLSAICFAAMARTGYYGGQIRHTEIRTGAAVNLQNEREQDKTGQDNKNEEYAD